MSKPIARVEIVAGHKCRLGEQTLQPTSPESVCIDIVRLQMRNEVVRIIMRSIAKVFCLVASLVSGEAAAQNAPFSGLDDTLKDYGSDYAAMRQKIQSSSARLSYVPGRDELSIMERYTFFDNEIIETGQNQDGISSIYKSTFLYSFLPHQFNHLNSPGATDFLLSVGYRIVNQYRGSMSTVMFSRVWYPPPDGFAISNHIVYVDGRFSSIVWFCIP